jgi:hypothetical protein
MPLPAVIYRCLENRTLPCSLKITARCPWPGCVSYVEFNLPLLERSAKPTEALCNICGRELRIISAVALTGNSGRF